MFFLAFRVAEASVRWSVELPPPKKIKKSFDRRPRFASFPSYEITFLLPTNPIRRWFQRERSNHSYN
jgi:hypothetical protein